MCLFKSPCIESKNTNNLQLKLFIYLKWSSQNLIKPTLYSCAEEENNEPPQTKATAKIATETKKTKQLLARSMHSIIKKRTIVVLKCNRCLWKTQPTASQNSLLRHIQSHKPAFQLSNRDLRLNAMPIYSLVCLQLQAKDRPLRATIKFLCAACKLQPKRGLHNLNYRACNAGPHT